MKYLSSLITIIILHEYCNCHLQLLYRARKKERANYFYKRNDFINAIHLYTRALEYLDHRDGDPDAEFGKEDLEV